MAIDLTVGMIDIEGIEDRYQAWLHQNIRDELNLLLDSYFKDVPADLIQKLGNIRIEHIDVACTQGMPMQKRVQTIAKTIATEIYTQYPHDIMPEKGA